jgi:hypothetical protein
MHEIQNKMDITNYYQIYTVKSKGYQLNANNLENDFEIYKNGPNVTSKSTFKNNPKSHNAFRY